MPRRYLRRRSLDDSAEQEFASTGTAAPVVTDERSDARLTELLITKGPQRGNGNGGAVPQTSVARLQRLAGNRAVADRLGGSGATIQRARNRASDEEDALPEPAQAGPAEAPPVPESEAAPSAQAGPVEAPPGPESGAAASAQAGPLPEAAAAPTAGEAAKAGILESAEKPASVEDEPTGLDKLVQERVAPIVGETGRVLPDAEVEAKPGSGAPEGGRVLPDAEIVGETGRVLPDAEVEAKPGSGAPEGGRVLPDAEIEAKPKEPLPGVPEGGSGAPVEMPGPTGGGSPGTAAPGIEVPGSPTPELGETVPSEEGPAPTVEQPAAESLPAGDQAQITIMNSAGAQAVATAAKANAGADKMVAAGVSLAGLGFATALRQAMSRAVQWRGKILGIAPTVVGKAARMLTNLRTTASTMIQNITLKVKSVADAAKGVLGWARQALGIARAAARGIANKLRSALGGVGEAVLRFLSSLVAPARTALDQLLKTGSDVLLDGIKQVRVAAASAVAFVKEEVGTVLEAALAKVVELVRRVVKAALERARRAMDVIDKKVGEARKQLLTVGRIARALLLAARSRASNGTGTAMALIVAAMANGYRQLTTGRGRRVLRQNWKMWLTVIRDLRRRAKSRFTTGKAIVKRFDGAGRAAIGAARAEARANYRATRASLKDLERTAANEASGLGSSVGEAAKIAAGAIDAAVTEGETLIREVAGEGDRDKHELQGLINRTGK